MAAKRPARASLRYAKAPLSPRYRRELHQLLGHCLFEVISQRYERGSIVIISNLPFDEWTEIFGSVRLTGAILDRLTHHVHILEMNGESFRLRESRTAQT